MAARSLNRSRKLVSGDTGLATSVLRTVNSASVGLRVRVADIRQAVTLFGLKRIRVFGMGLGVKRVLPEPGRPFDSALFWQRSMQRAAFAEALSGEILGATTGDEFTGALLQDMALPLLLSKWAKDYAPVWDEAVGGEVSLCDVEEARLSWNHAQAGAWLASHWGFPDVLVCCIGLHHFEMTELHGMGLHETPILSVAVASRLPDVEAICVQELGLTPSVFERICSKTNAQCAELAAAFGLLPQILSWVAANNPLQRPLACSLGRRDSSYGAIPDRRSVVMVKILGAELRLADLSVPTLGPCTNSSPVCLSDEQFVDGSRRVLAISEKSQLEAILVRNETVPSFEMAGPRREVFFEPKTLTCGIVTCGGLCPGLNDVIRSVYLTATHTYGVKRVIGFRYGFLGLTHESSSPPIEITSGFVESLHETGGTVLGSSRGPQDVGEMVDVLVKRMVGILFVIGGDGSLRGASALAVEIEHRGLPIAVVAIPKTIDNDIEWIGRSFGFATAVEEAHKAITAAHTEATGAYDGIGIVKLMGRHSGFITAHATLASCDVNFCLVPEVPVELEGSKNVLKALERRLDEKHHAVIVVAEGAGQELFKGPEEERDASGNVKLQDIGVYLRSRIAQHFHGRGREVTIKYIDPSYIIRSLPANSMDSEFCLILGQHAVHAAMAGFTNVVIGFWNQHFTQLPIAVAVSRRKTLNPRGRIWPRVLETTGQESYF